MSDWQKERAKLRGTSKTRKTTYDAQAPLDLTRKPAMVYRCQYDTAREMCRLSAEHCLNENSGFSKCPRYIERGLAEYQ